LTSTIGSVIDWIDSDSFKIAINLPLRKGGIDSINCNDKIMQIIFMNDTGISIAYPDNLDNLIIVMERKLTNWDGYYEGHGLQGYIIDRILVYVKDHFKEIKEAIEKAKDKRTH